MDSSSDTHKRPRFDFEKFSNSKVLSDITIRYGASGELKFEAHRLLLSAQSRWLETAFTGGFVESHAREITLVGDDPDALKTMLRFAYDQQIHPSESPPKGTIVNIKRFLELYRMGDKYQFPALLIPVASQFRSCMDGWLHGDDEPFANDCDARSEFCGFVRDIYELVGPEHRPSHPLVQILLELATDWPITSILKNTGDGQPLIVMASQKVAEFGRDIFLNLMDKTGLSEANSDSKRVTTRLCIGVALICWRCRETSWKVMTDDEEKLSEVCRHCGQALEHLEQGRR
ncbi:hypothetical protein AA0120_g1969 [Alternaria tenuissima]|nr:hypothetical protein AA0120_g1969 [Alternaria tenuissima]